ncbi:MAG: Eco57I restriction-modification methylase domain-containing protein [Bacteroidales bacterium]|nr:Eco57I restriction-modification methylase domain-containing protein [Bacteroidales bacterium]
MERFFEAPKPKLIYAFRISDAAHAGCVKVGETTFALDEDQNPFDIKPNSTILNKAARKRIDQYTSTAGISYELLHTEMTLHMRGMKMVDFSDKDVHKVLLRSGIKRKKFSGASLSHGKEWFETDLATVKKAIAAVKEGRKSLTAEEVSIGQSPIEFRPEQREAIDRTKKRFEKYPAMLWNAKMRFGKTLSALQVVKEIGFGRTLLYTHRPDVLEGWFEDFNKIFFDRPDFRFGSKRGLGSPLDALEKRRKKSSINYVFFASLQDLRGSEIVGGKFKKNDDVFSIPWDFVIVDEAHEGTQTALGKAVYSELLKSSPKRLELTGTAFNLMDNFDESEIFTWDYTMEQRAKQEWDRSHFGDPNPYAGLPRMNIYTYDLGRLLSDFADEEIAFNFREFFRTLPDGSFKHEAEVRSFLDLLTREDERSLYPFANARYRAIFRHTLWMVPGVKEAKALSAMLKRHPVFGYFDIVNVAGDGDEEQERDKALKLVRDAIGNCSHGTITLSCGRLTTGVTVPEWTGVLMLSGSYNTAASSYMQTIFRVQTPWTREGLTKEDCYVFDFAPDRTLQVLATVPRVSTKAGKTTGEQKRALGEFLNFCPVIGMEGSKMKPYDANSMMEQLKRAYVERVVRNGFEDGYLYNDQLLQLDAIEVRDFNALKGIIGQTKAMAKSGQIDINSQGLTGEEYEEKEKLERKKKRELTEEEKARLAELKARKKMRDEAVSILRGISIRMPLLIYGAKIDDEDAQLTIGNFTNLVDDLSWEEFMPRGVTKARFEKFRKYYDEDVFASAAKRIRSIARAADRLTVEERIERIASIFNTFRNPDKETVLTPWRVVNMHIADTLGGFCFYDEKYEEKLTEPRYVDHGRVTNEAFDPDGCLLEINSKSGLYPLYLAYNLYRRALKDCMSSPETLEEHQAIWDRVVSENIFVVCKTPMAKSITRRTLMGFREGRVNTRYFEDLVNQIKNKPENFLAKIVKGKSFWKANTNDQMKFQAIVGNPPYQVMDGGAQASALPVYQYFVEIAKRIPSFYISMIMPARWYAGGRGLDDFRNSMLQDIHIKELHDFPKASDLFSNVEIKGGLCYFLMDSKYDNTEDWVSTVTHSAGNLLKTQRPLSTDSDEIFVRDSRSLSIIDKVKAVSSKTLESWISPLRPFGLRGYFVSDSKFRESPNNLNNPICCIGKGLKKGYMLESEVPAHINWINRYKVIIPRANNIGTEANDDNLNAFIGEPGVICTESYLCVGADKNLSKEECAHICVYMYCRFTRFMHSLAKSSQDATAKTFRFVPELDFKTNDDIDWSQSIPDIDRQLYAKYSLTPDEISFIESMIKPM